MNVNLYHNKSLANVVNKTIGTATVVTGTAFVLPFDERFPKIRFTSSTDWDDFNYAQIDGKYYYITGVEHVTNVETIISLELDLLKEVSVGHPLTVEIHMVSIYEQLHHLSVAFRQFHTLVGYLRILKHQA